MDQALERRWIRMIDFRNVLVHDYLEVDRCLVHRGDRSPVAGRRR
ncbi:MAG: HepT-like ribonuclease domain-containing protein [Gammaproteobacteria bacterium]